MSLFLQRPSSDPVQSFVYRNSSSRLMKIFIILTSCINVNSFLQPGLGYSKPIFHRCLKREGIDAEKNDILFDRFISLPRTDITRLLRILLDSSSEIGVYDKQFINNLLPVDYANMTDQQKTLYIADLEKFMTSMDISAKLLLDIQIMKRQKSVYIIECLKTIADERSRYLNTRQLFKNFCSRIIFDKNEGLKSLTLELINGKTIDYSNQYYTKLFDDILYFIDKNEDFRAEFLKQYQQTVYDVLSVKNKMKTALEVDFLKLKEMCSDPMLNMALSKHKDASPFLRLKIERYMRICHPDTFPAFTKIQNYLSYNSSSSCLESLYDQLGLFYSTKENDPLWESENILFRRKLIAECRKLDPMRFRDTDALSDDEVQHVVLEASVSITMSSDKSNNPYVWLY